MVRRGRIDISFSAFSSGEWHSALVFIALYRSLSADEELIVTWINPNGEPIPMEIGYVPDWDNAIIITGSISAFNLNSNAGEAVPIVSQGDELEVGSRSCFKH